MLFDQTGFICFQQLMQIIDPVIDLFASVRIGDIGALFQLFHKMNCRGVAVFAFDKGLVFGEIQAVRIIDQRISGNARCRLIRLGNAAGTSPACAVSCAVKRALSELLSNGICGFDLSRAYRNLKTPQA